MPKLFYFFLFIAHFGFSQANLDSLPVDSFDQVDSVEVELMGTPFVFQGDTIYWFYGALGPFSVEDRMVKFEKNLRKLGLKKEFEYERLNFTHTPWGGVIKYDDETILTVTKLDAEGQGKSVFYLLNEAKNSVAAALKKQKETWAWGDIILPFFSIIGLIVFGVLWWRWISQLARFLREKSQEKGFKILEKTKYRDYRFIDEEKGRVLLSGFIRIARIAFLGLGYYVLLLLVFSLFPATEGFANQLFQYVLQPITGMTQGVIAFIPNLIKMIVIVLIARAVVRFLAYLTGEIAKGHMEIPGFFADWAKPTFNIFRLLIYTITFILIYPYLPGYESPIFLGFIGFFGLMVALGTIPASQNFFAGLGITYMRPFQIGDRIKTGELSGVVVEKGGLSVKIRTSKNEEVSVPNSHFFNHKTINYSSNVEKNGVILHSTVVVGYNVPWQKAHEMLERAARQTSKILDEPRPFVLERELSKAGVHYQINAFTNNATQLSAAYAELYQNILDVFEKENVRLGG